MSTPCRRIPPRWDDLRPFAANRGQFAPQSIEDGRWKRRTLVRRQEVPRPAGLQPRPKRARKPGLKPQEQEMEVVVFAGLKPGAPTLFLRQFAANSGAATCGLPANYHVCNILPGMPRIKPEVKLISGLISILYVLPATAPSELTPYSAIFCRPVFANQQLARLHRKIFKIRNLKVNDFNILRIIVRNLLKTDILCFYFF
jgi:hypothetical protein